MGGRLLPQQAVAFGLLVGLVGGLALHPQVRSRPEIGLLAFNIS